MVFFKMSKTVIKSRHNWKSINLKELWEYRELLLFLVWKDIRIRYKQSLLGAAWAVIQPFSMMVIFSVFFGRFMKVPSEGIPYPVFAYCALVPWTYFSNSLTKATSSVIDYQGIITKVYFPRILLPLSAVLQNLFDFLIAFVLLIIMILFFNIGITPKIFLSFMFLMLMILTAAGAGFLLSAINVEYRDVRHAITFIVQLWLFATPIAYPASIVPERWRTLYGLNPLVGIIEGFRWSLTGKSPPDIKMLSVSFLTIMILLLLGIFCFRNMEKTFADVV